MLRSIWLSISLKLWCRPPIPSLVHLILMSCDSRLSLNSSYIAVLHCFKLLRSCKGMVWSQSTGAVQLHLLASSGMHPSNSSRPSILHM